MSGFISPEKSSRGRGGMLTKCGVALKLAGEGIPVVIANGRTPDILVDVVDCKSDVLCTRFEPKLI